MRIQPHRGEVAAVESVETGARLSIDLPFAEELGVGESVAVNGCCLTVTAVESGKAVFDLLAETQRVTNLGDLEQGGLVNLERSFCSGTRRLH